jgi:branched-chain amino acid transport system substrate-binding protein
VIAYGALTTGGTTIDDTVAGKKPIIANYGFNPADISTKSLFALFGESNFSIYPVGTFGGEYLHAKTAAIVYPNQPGSVGLATSIKLASVAEGMKVNLVDFDPTSTDLTGAFTAAGAQTAGYVVDLAATPDNCLSSVNALTELHVDPNKVYYLQQCNDASIKAQYPGGDYPHYWTSVAQSGDVYAKDPTGVAFTAALAKFGQAANASDDWYSAVWGQVLTIAQFMNRIGYAHLSTKAIVSEVKAFRGPLLLGGPDIHCGKYRFAPGSCSDGNYFFHYKGNGVTVRSAWIEPPQAFQKSLEARKPGSGFPSA